MLGFRPLVLPTGEINGFGKLVERLNLFGVVCSFFDEEDGNSYLRYGIPVIVTYLPEEKDYLIGFIDAELYIDEENGRLDLQRDIRCDDYRVFFRRFSKIIQDLCICGADQLTTEQQLKERREKEEKRYEEEKAKRKKEEEKYEEEERQLRRELGLEREEENDN